MAAILIIGIVVIVSWMTYLMMAATSTVVVPLIIGTALAIVACMFAWDLFG